MFSKRGDFPNLDLKTLCKLTHIQKPNTEFKIADNSSDISSIIVVGLSISKYAKDFELFTRQNAFQRIQTLVKRIATLCEKFSEKYPTGLWIFSWRENGIAEAQKSYLSNQFKTYLKSELIKLCNRYPQLVVIAQVSSVKKIDNNDFSKKITDVFENYNFQSDFVANQNDSVLRTQWNDHLQQVVTELNSHSQAERRVMRNTIYVIQQSKIQKHDKIFPFDETLKLDSKDKHIVFQPPKDKNSNNIFEITHPITKQIITIGVEICFEHCLGLVMKKSKQPLDLQFISSDTVFFKQHHMNAKYLIHLDSHDRTALHKDTNAHANIQLKMYKNDLTQSSDCDLKRQKCHKR